MNNYVPFLKLKVNEVAALGALDGSVKDALVPFFDLPRKADMTDASLKALIDKSARSVTKNLSEFSEFYVDDFDIDDALMVDGGDKYLYVIDRFRELPWIPVVGLDRSAGRSALVFKAKRTGDIAGDSIALRLQPEDFDDFGISGPEVRSLLERYRQDFSDWHLILDCRVCVGVDPVGRSDDLINFISALRKEFDCFERIIITGSSMPASIRDVLGVESEESHARNELAIFRNVVGEIGSGGLVMGDYTIVSPLYSDINIPPESMRNVTAPKVIYSHADVHHIFRGGALKTHPRGNLQYNDIARKLVARPFFRGAAYSFGDDYVHQKALDIGPGVTPSSILKPTINTHITYMVSDFVV